MKHISIIIPTRNRFSSLMRLIHSIPVTDCITTYVMFDNDKAGHDKLVFLKHPNVVPMLSNTHIGSVACRNIMAKKVKDGLIFLCDDMELPDTFDYIKVMSDFNREFKDNDGVFGIAQNLPEYHPTGVALIGREFLKRYPNKQFLNPEYWLFAAQEIHWLASSLNRFKMYDDLTVYHYHPAYKRSVIDSTHKDGRVHISKDTKIREHRIKNNLIWGLNNEK